MVDRRLLLLLALGVVGSCVAQTDTLTITQETEEGTTQTIVQDSKGAVIKIQPMTRDTSWPTSIVYNPTSFYELLPQLYHDKISIREVKLGKLDYAFSLFVSILPRQWQPSSSTVTVWHLDLLDAMTIGAQDASSEIVQSALTQIPYTKAALASGKTTDFMNQVFSVDGKFKIDQFIDLSCDSMATKVNKYRVTKWASSLYAASLATPGINKITSQLTIEPAANVFKIVLGRAFDLSVDPLHSKLGKTGDSDNTKMWITRIVGGAAVVTAALAHRLQHIYINGYIKVLDLLISADTVTFDHAVAYKKIKELKDKLVWFGISNQQAEQLQVVLNKL